MNAKSVPHSYGSSHYNGSCSAGSEGSDCLEPGLLEHRDRSRIHEAWALVSLAHRNGFDEAATLLSNAL